MEKPLQLRIEDAKNNIIKFINDESNRNDLDYYFLFYIMKDIYSEINILKEKELQELKIEEGKNDSDRR